MALDLSKYGTPITPGGPAAGGLNLAKYGTPIGQPQQTPPNMAQPGYFSRVGSEFAKAGADITGAVGQAADTLQHNDGSIGSELKSAGGLVQAGLRTAGGVAGAAFAPITELPIVHQAISGIASEVAKIPGVQQIAAKASELSTTHPELAKDIQAIANIALLGTPSSGAGTAITDTGAGALKDSADAVATKNLDGFVRKLLTPEQTKAIKEDQVARTTETGSGIFKRSVVAPTPAQLRAEDAVKAVPGINPSATVQQNYNVIKAANTAEAQRLEQAVAANNFIIPRKETMARLDEAAQNLSSSPLIVGDAEKMAQRLIDGAREFVDHNPGTGSGLLEARKQYDRWVLDQKPKAFDASAENAFTIANRQVRQAFNNLLDEKATSVDVKASLSHQSALFNALDTLTPKAAIEADTAIGRGMQRVGKVLGTKSKVVQGIAAAAGIGGLGAAATFAPIVAGVGVPAFLTYKAGQLVLKPGVRRAVANLLQEAGPKLEKTDRAFLEGILQEYGQDQLDEGQSPENKP